MQGREPDNITPRSPTVTPREARRLAAAVAGLSATAAEPAVAGFRLAEEACRLLRAERAEHAWLGPNDRPAPPSAHQAAGEQCDPGLPPAWVRPTLLTQARERPRAVIRRLDLLTNRAPDAHVLLAAIGVEGYVLAARVIRRRRGAFGQRERLLARLLFDAAKPRLARTLAAGVPAVPPALADTLGLLLQGFSEKEIAHQLDRSRHTVHAHVRRIYALHDVNSRAGLLARFIARG